MVAGVAVVEPTEQTSSAPPLHSGASLWQPLCVPLMTRHFFLISRPPCLTSSHRELTKLPVLNTTDSMATQPTYLQRLIPLKPSGRRFRPLDIRELVGGLPGRRRHDGFKLEGEDGDSPSERLDKDLAAIRRALIGSVSAFSTTSSSTTNDRTPSD